MRTTKLSKLQHWMLTRAASKPDKSENGTCTDLLTARVLSEFYGMPLTPWRQRDGVGTGSNFRPASDGRSYASARVAISKAFARLEQRGLATRLEGAISRWAGIDLTDEGKRLTQTQSCLNVSRYGIQGKVARHE